MFVASSAQLVFSDRKGLFGGGSDDGFRGGGVGRGVISRCKFRLVFILITELFTSAYPNF